MSSAILDGADIGARKGGKMSELIERQRAIELVRDICDAIMSGCGCHYDAEVDDEVFDDILEVDAILKCNKEIRIGLQHLPSVQPEPSQVARDIADIIENEKDMRVIARSEITDEQAILHLQASGWMQRHDKEMYESGLRARITDDSDSYDALLESVQPEQTRIFVELVVEYPDPELCTYKEYRGKPYYSIKYIENGETHIGFGTYKPEVLSQYLKENFISSAQPDRSCIDQIKWERDTAIQQLNELGYSSGEAIRHDKDTINRKGAIIAVCTVLYPDADKMNDAKKVLKEMPSAQPKQQWIPVSERLPEDFQRVLVTIVNYEGDKVIRVAEYHNWKGAFQIKENHEQWKVGEKGLLAWMPLPETYREKGRNK